ncbi:MAG: type IV pili twitching motility protein PilT, partial [Flavobacteriales bacterium]|nr:type IV pili twitching motility protein PilT [Flavobacteriales bacterium]
MTNDNKAQQVSMHDLLKETVSKRASDLHLTAGVPPMFRVDGQLVAGNYPVLGPEMTERLAYSVLSEEQRKAFEMNKELDVAFGISGLSRFRLVRSYK